MKEFIAPIPRPALVLGLGGLLPFFATAIASIALDSPPEEAGIADGRAVQALGAYGAVILSFLGGVRWGDLLDDSVRINQWMPLTLSVVPSLIAWSALLLGATSMLAVLIVGFAFQYSLDRAAVQRGALPEWFGRLRLILTCGALLSLIVTLLLG